MATILNHKQASKNIADQGISYNVDTKTLTVPFKSFKQPIIITTYEYYNVPYEIWDELTVAESVGSAINKLVVKGGFEYKKL